MPGKVEVRAGDLQVDAESRVLNPDLHVATLRQGTCDSGWEVEIDGGRGYVSAVQHSQTERPIGVIPIDSLFSPCSKVNYNVETPVGQRIDYDKLTHRGVDRRQHPAVGRGAVAGQDSCVTTSTSSSTSRADRGGGRGGGRRGCCAFRKLLEKSVEELELSVRSSNCLRAAEIRRSATWCRRASRRCSSTATSAASRSRRSRTSWRDGAVLRDGRQPYSKKDAARLDA
jgi:DNA-directed RNA polymerase subunit alpha